MADISEKTIGRLSLYRRILREISEEGNQNVFSHQIARQAGVTPAQVRRDFMILGCAGSPVRGYETQVLIDHLVEFLDIEGGEPIALIGVGNLGRAILSYFGSRPNLRIVATFDTDPNKVDRLINSCPCYFIDKLPEIIEEKGIQTAIISVPASVAQSVADGLVMAGVCGILNFAPTRLRVPDGVYVEDIDLAMALEKVAYFSRQNK